MNERGINFWDAHGRQLDIATFGKSDLSVTVARGTERSLTAIITPEKARYVIDFIQSVLDEAGNGEQGG